MFQQLLLHFYFQLDSARLDKAEEGEQEKGKNLCKGMRLKFFRRVNQLLLLLFWLLMIFSSIFFTHSRFDWDDIVNSNIPLAKFKYSKLYWFTFFKKSFAILKNTLLNLSFLMLDGSEEERMSHFLQLCWNGCISVLVFLAIIIIIIIHNN